jgi:hypothetical protein
VSSSAACFCVIASKKLLVASNASFSLIMGLVILSINLSDNRSAIVLETESSAWSRRRKATDLMAVLASDGSLNASVTDSKMSASLILDGPSLFRSQPLPSSQDRASLAEVIGLGEALI